jgi:DNA-binding response OmpR family regulator
MRVLLIEDEIYIAKPIEQALKRDNYSVDLAFDGEHGLDCGLTDVYDIVVLDIMLPKMDGITVLRELRKNGVKTPVLLLTAKKQIQDRIDGLDSGADDYLVKPFDTNELLARLRALGRRRSEIDFDGILRIGNIELNPHTLFLNSGDNSCKLTLKEAHLLELLIKRKGMITPKELIIEKLWGYDSDTEDGHVEYHVSLLRKKLITMNAKISIITVRGVGYSLNENDGEK